MATEQERNRGAGAYSSPGVDKPGFAGEAQIITSTPIASFKLQNVDPPSAFYMTQDDILRLVVWNSVPGLTVILAGRWLRIDGKIIPFRFDFIPTSLRAVSTFTTALGEGFLLNVNAQSTIGTAFPFRGQTFCTVDLLRGGSANPFRVTVLFADYLTDGNALAWPQGQIRQSIEGPGWVQSLGVANPAAGANWSVTVPTNARWLVRGITFTLTTSATVATRTVEVNLTDGVNQLQVFPAFNTQAASLGFRYNANSTTANVTTDTTQIQIPIYADLRMVAGWVLSTTTVNIQVGDQYSGIRLTLEEWIETN